ncbi:hypothetical protein Plo01_01900 [Planobispora longispora]|uniref:OmpR/PhoB-type domain-containing protein n=2 Tax=Planobispora longispora TaxID=28887 RepID=A0A8J3RGF3_9ACTN|nr:AfsR/SARP family transcriptional regulator [Planobispora longispora]GIH73761.1 hypothetical protein Plo01_01900 [Planobispora longispora]
MLSDRHPGAGVLFHILGPLTVRTEHGPADLGTNKQRLLLAVLLCRPEKVLSTDCLAYALWGDKPPSSAASNIRLYVHRLRRALGRDRIITQGRAGYRLRAQPPEIDAHRFADLVHDGHAAFGAGDPHRASQRLRSALSLWRDRPFTGMEDEPALQAEADRMKEIHLSAVELRLDADLALGHHVGLVPELVGLVAEHPLREHLHAQLMLALYRSGRQAEALDVYRRIRRLLVRELGLEPGSELRAMEAMILSGASFPSPRLPSFPGPHPLPEGSRPLMESHQGKRPSHSVDIGVGSPSGVQ